MQNEPEMSQIIARAGRRIVSDAGLAFEDELHAVALAPENVARWSPATAVRGWRPGRTSVSGQV